MNKEKIVDNQDYKDVVKDAYLLYLSYKKAATKEAKIQNLDKLWEILESIRYDGSRDYSITEIGQRMEKLNGLKAQSLRNKQGEDYRNIISAFADAVNGSKKYVAKTHSNAEQALNMISDPTVRATFRRALDEAKRLKVVNDNLHSAFQNLALDLNSGLTKVNSDSAQENSIQLYQPLLPTRLLQALKKGVDVKRLSQQGLLISEDGGIESEDGDKIFPPGFVTAITTILHNEQ